MIANQQSFTRSQKSESFLLSALLALSGGLQDAYTYACRGHVFANAQTGNIVLLSAALTEGVWKRAFFYLIPLLSFLLGVFVAEHVRCCLRHSRNLHWRQFIVIIEISLLFIVGFLPQGLNMAAGAIVSFVCAMQVQTFRKVYGNAYASTMCIGNMRSCMESLHSYFYTKNALYLFKAFIYCGVIVLFAFGAGLGYVLTKLWGEQAIWASCSILALGFAAMTAGKTKENKSKHNYCIIKRSSIMGLSNKEIEAYLPLNALTTGNGVVIFGGATDRTIPIGELKQSFNLNEQLFNRSLSGLTIEHAISAYDLCAAELNPESVLLHIGEEDLERFAKDHKGFRADYCALITHIRQFRPKCRIAVLSLFNPEALPDIATLNSQLKDLAASESCEFCDLDSISSTSQCDRELLGFMYDLGFVRPLKIKRPLYQLAKLLYCCTENKIFSDQNSTLSDLNSNSEKGIPAA